MQSYANLKHIHQCNFKSQCTLPQIFQGKKLDACILLSMLDASWLKTFEIGMLYIKIYVFGANKSIYRVKNGMHAFC